MSEHSRLMREWRKDALAAEVIRLRDLSESRLAQSVLLAGELSRRRARVVELEAAQLPATITETRERISRLLDHLVELAVGDGEVEP